MKSSQQHTTPALRPFLWSTLFLSSCLAGQIAGAADLRVAISGLKSAEGDVHVGLFSAADDFPDHPWRRASTAATPGAVTVTFKDLPAGTYAVSAFQDVNGNKKLDKNGLGLPTEPYGFSRDARRAFGPPAFGDARFGMQEGAARSVELQLK